MKKKIRQFELHWLHGEVQKVEGYDILDACNKAGIGGGAIRALDYYSEVKTQPKKACTRRAEVGRKKVSSKTKKAVKPARG